MDPGSRDFSGYYATLGAGNGSLTATEDVDFVKQIASFDVLGCPSYARQPCVRTATIAVPVNGDTDDESDETFSLSVWSGAASGHGQGVIIDNDAAPAVDPQPETPDDDEDDEDEDDE